MIREFLTTSFNTFKMKAKAFRDPARPCIANPDFDLYTVQSQLGKSKIQDGHAARCHNPYTLKLRYEPIAQFCPFVPLVNFFNGDESCERINVPDLIDNIRLWLITLQDGTDKYCSIFFP